MNQTTSRQDAGHQPSDGLPNDKNPRGGRGRAGQYSDSQFSDRGSAVLGEPLGPGTAHVVPFGAVRVGEDPDQLLSELHDASHDTLPGLVIFNLPIGRGRVRQGSWVGGASRIVGIAVARLPGCHGNLL